MAACCVQARGARGSDRLLNGKESGMTWFTGALAVIAALYLATLFGVLATG